MSLLNYTQCPTSEIIAAISQYVVLGLVLLYIATIDFQEYEKSILASNEYRLYNDKTRKVTRNKGKRFAYPKTFQSTDSQTKIQVTPDSDGEDSQGNRNSNPNLRSAASSIRRQRSYDSNLSGLSEDGVLESPLYPPVVSTARRSSVDLGGTHRRQGSIDRTIFPNQPVITDDVPEPGLRTRKLSTARRNNRNTYNSDLETQFEEIPLSTPTDARSRPSTDSRRLGSQTPEPSAPSAPPAVTGDTASPYARRRPSNASQHSRTAPRPPVNSSVFNVKPF